MPELTPGCHVLLKCLRVFVQNVYKGLRFLLFLSQTDEVFQPWQQPCLLIFEEFPSQPYYQLWVDASGRSCLGQTQGTGLAVAASQRVTKLPSALLGTLQSFRNSKNPTDISFASLILYSCFFLSSHYIHTGAVVQ